MPKEGPFSRRKNTSKVALFKRFLVSGRKSTFSGFGSEKWHERTISTLSDSLGTVPAIPNSPIFGGQQVLESVMERNLIPAPLLNPMGLHLEKVTVAAVPMIKPQIGVN